MLVLQILSTFFMTGLIWMVQVVHYPLFKNINQEEFVEYERQHSKRITFIVGPVMFVELGSAILILTSGLFEGFNYNLFLISFGLLILIWMSTMFVQVPHHRKITMGYDLETINNLVSYNWIRTLLWSARTIILSYILYGLL